VVARKHPPHHPSVSYLVDSDWLIDAFVGVPTAVQLLAGLPGDGLAVSIHASTADALAGERII
jgi:hypothetical protein